MTRPENSNIVITEKDGTVEIAMPSKVGVRSFSTDIFVIGPAMLFAIITINIVSFHEPATFIPVIIFAVVMYFPVRTWLWQREGTEYLTIGKDTMTLERVGKLASKKQFFRLAHVRSIRVITGLYSDYIDDPEFKGYRPFSLDEYRAALGNGGRIIFEYNGKKKQIATEITAEEAVYIIHTLTERGFLKENNL